MKNENIYSYFIMMFGFVSLFYIGLIYFSYIREIIDKIHIKKVKDEFKQYLIPQNKIVKIVTIIIVVIFYIFILLLLLIRYKFLGILLFVLMLILILTFILLLSIFLIKQIKFEEYLYTKIRNTNCTIWVITNILLISVFVMIYIASLIETNGIFLLHEDGQLKNWLILSLLLILFLAFYNHLYYIYLWMGYPEYLLQYYGKGININGSFIVKAKVFLSVLVWNTYYLIFEFLTLLPLTNTNNIGIKLYQIINIMLFVANKIAGIDGMIGLSDISEFDQKILSLFILWGKIIYFVVIGLFILSLIKEKSGEKQK